MRRFRPTPYAPQGCGGVHPFSRPQTNRGALHTDPCGGVVPTPTGYGAAIRTEYNAIDPTRMPGQGAEVFTRFRAPQTNGLVVTATGYGATIRTE